MNQPRRRSVLVSLLARTEPPTQAAILAELRRVILDGGAPPGTPVPVDDVADAFGVSRIPVRESLKTLVGEGLVDHAPRAGYAVARLTPAELGEMYLVRAALEAAALRSAVDHATAEDDAEVARVHDEQAAAMDRGDATAYHRGSRSFHFALLAPSQMHRLLHMFEAAWNVTEPVQPMTLVPALTRAALHDDHTRMLAAFRARDRHLLAACSHEHYQRLSGAVAHLPGQTAPRTLVPAAAPFEEYP